MNPIEQSLCELDKFLKAEAEAFRRSAESCTAVVLPRYAMYCLGVSHGYDYVRSWMRTTIPFNHLAPSVPGKLTKDLLG